MALEMGLWRADGGKLTRLAPSGVGLESQLEDYIVSDPGLMGQQLLLIGRQVRTDDGGFIDLLAVDGEGAVHVLELKRDRTPRDVVAQALDYGSWVASRTRDDIVSIFANYRHGLAFEEAFAEEFGEAPPEELNTRQELTIVAASVDPATERIVRFLKEGFDVPVNVVFFRQFEDQGTSYLARTWLVNQEAQVVSAASAKVRKSREPWNGHDWYVSFGEGPNGRSWEDAARYGFVSAGGGEWYSHTLRNLTIGARVFVYLPKYGYVGVGTVTGEAVPFGSAEVLLDGTSTRLADLPLHGNYGSPEDTTESAEYVVPVDWDAVRTRDQAFRKPGLFTNRNSACHLNSEFTIREVVAFFHIED